MKLFVVYKIPAAFVVVAITSLQSAQLCVTCVNGDSQFLRVNYFYSYSNECQYIQEEGHENEATVTVSDVMGLYKKMLKEETFTLVLLPFMILVGEKSPKEKTSCLVSSSYTFKSGFTSFLAFN